MKRKSSIHIEQGKLGYLFHNDRTKQTANSIFSTENNEYDNDAKTALEIYRQELQKRTQAYTRRTGKKLPKNTITHLSAIVNLDERHTLQDVEKIAEYLEKKFDTKVFQIAVHKDEGYVDENGTPHINYHAHIEFMGLKSDGKSIKKHIKRKDLIELQTQVAKILQMERGINYTAERKKRPKRLDTYEYKEHARRQAEKTKLLDSILYLIEQTAKVRGIEIKTIEQAKEFLQETQEGLKLYKEILKITGKHKILDLQELDRRLEQTSPEEIAKIRKEIESIENIAKVALVKQVGQLAKVKDLKEENKRLREQLKEAGAKREHYAQLEQFVKDLKEKVKAKELTIEQLKEQMQAKEKELLEQIKEKEEEIEHKNKTIEKLNNDVEELTEQVYSPYKMKSGRQATWEDVAKHYITEFKELKPKFDNYKKEKEAELEQLKKEKEAEKKRRKKAEEEAEELKKELKRLKNTPATQREIAEYSEQLRKENKQLKEENKQLKEFAFSIAEILDVKNFEEMITDLKTALSKVIRAAKELKDYVKMLINLNAELNEENEQLKNQQDDWNYGGWKM